MDYQEQKQLEAEPWEATIIDEMLNGMPDEFSSEEIDARAEILFRHVGRQFAASSSTGPGEGRVVH